MAWAPPALAAVTLCLCVSTDLLRATAADPIIGAVLSNAEHPDFPSSLLTEFPCIPTGDLPAADILAFARGLQSEPGELSSAQLSCLARLLAAKNLTADFGSFPPDLLLFFDPSEVRAGSCREFYARASRGNLELLPRGSARRMRLLRGALTCLGVRGSRLEPRQLGSLGALVCDMEPATIPASGPAVLDSLKLCPALTGEQQDALNALLLTGNTEYGDPSSWDLRTLQDLGPLALALNQSTLRLVGEAAREDFRRSIAAAYRSQGHSQREKSLILLRAFSAASSSSRPRMKRSADRCLSEPITASSIANDILILDYTPEQLDLCLSNDVLIENLEALLEQSFTSEYLQILKKKVDEIFPEGIPEEQLTRLGSLCRLYSEQEISRWPVTSSDTLLALLNPSGEKCEDSQVPQLLSRFLSLGGSLTGPLLREIGGKRLCNLQEEQLQQIPAEAIGAAGQLDISSCSQPQKEQFYRKAREAFASLAGTPGPYYCRLRPYLGGAPAEDLKKLANSGVAINMDLDTFLALNPEELLKLSVCDVKNLLGDNVEGLEGVEWEPAVRAWVETQFQWELDCVLDIGLQGGRPEPLGTATPLTCITCMAAVTSTATATTPPSPTLSASVTPSASVTSMATATTPPHPTASASVTPVPTTVPTPTAITGHPSTLSPTPPPSGGSTVPSATPSAHPALTTMVPCSTPQSLTTTKATSPAVTLVTTLLATSSPGVTSTSSIPVPAVTSRATTSAGVGTDPAGTTHSTATPAPNVTSAPSATHSTAIPVPNATSAPTATHNTATPAPNATSAPSATHSTATPAPNATSAPSATHNTATPAPNATSAPSATHSTATPAPNATSSPTAITTVPNPTSAASATPVPHSTSVPAATAATHGTPPPHKPTPIPNSTIATPATSTAPPCPPSSPPGSPSPSGTVTSREPPTPTPGSVPESPRPTSNGYINLEPKPEPGSGSRLSSCLMHLLAVTLGNLLLLWGLL